MILIKLTLMLRVPLAIAQSASFGQDLGPSKNCVAEQLPRWNEMVSVRGNKEEPGKASTYAFFIPAGSTTRQDARVAVIAGALRVAIGPTLDEERAKSYPVGTFMLVPANVEHTLGRRR
jgi:hypothetical protein